MTAQTPISSLSTRGISALKALLGAVEEQPDANPEIRSLVSSLLTRFKLWVGNLGAHRPSGIRSLEYKLRDASMVQNHVVSLLQDLCLSIDKAFALVLAGDFGGDGNGFDSDQDSLADLEELERLWTDEGRDPDDRSNLDLALSGIQNAVDCLLRLSASIRNPAPHDHFKSKDAANYGAGFELYEKNRISEKYNHLDQAVLDRLAKSMVRRRQYLKYRADHAERIAHGVEAIAGGAEYHDGASEYTANQTAISSLPDHLKDDTLAAAAAEMDATDDLDDTRSQASATSYAETDVTTTELRMPRPPPESLHGPFKCPFCHMIITIQNRVDWKKHVYRDLQPYNCLYTSCRLPHQQFSRRSEWIEHMKREHWRVWRCSLGCADGIFDSAEELISHNKSAHAAEDKTTTLSSTPDISKAQGPCPLCLEVTIVSDKIYGKHVGDHLERLALFVLPSVDYGDESDEHNSDKNTDNSDKGDDDDGSDDGGIGDDGQSTTLAFNEVKPLDPSNQQSKQPDGPQEPAKQGADKRMDWETYLHDIGILASTFRKQGRWDEAEKLEVQVVETRKAKLGADHPDTLTSMANLAVTYKNQGRWNEAEKLEVQVMEMSKVKLGADHPNTLSSIANLASTFRKQGRWDEAEKLEVQVMEMSKAKLGAPDTQGY